MLYFEPFAKFSFHCPLHQIWSMVKSVTKFEKLVLNINKKLSIEPLNLSRDQTYEVNSKFRCCYQDIINLDFTVEEMIETDYYHMIKWIIEIPHQGTYTHCCTLVIWLHYLSNSLTLFMAQISMKQENRNGFGLLTKQEDISNYCKLIERFVMNTNDYSFNNESRIIKAPLKDCINYFKNARICTGLVGKVVNSTADEIKRGTIVINSMKEWGTGKDEQLVMQVRNCLNKSNSFKSAFFIYRKNETLPLRSMNTELYKVNGNETLVVLRHQFFTVISEREYKSIALGKKKFLKQIGNIIETINKD